MKRPLTPKQQEAVDVLAGAAGNDPLAREALEFMVPAQMPSLDQSVEIEPAPPTKPSGWLRRLFGR